MAKVYEKPSINQPDFKKDEPLLIRLKEQLIDIKRDIDLNYSRCYYKNPLVKILLKNLKGILHVYIRTLEQFETAESSDTEFTGSDKFIFGTSKQSIK